MKQQSSKIKLLQVHDYPPLEGGGIEVNVSRVGNKLIESGYEVTIATSRLSSETYHEKTRLKSDFKTESGVRVIFLDSLNILQSLIDEVDIVHVHFTFSCRPASMLAMEYCVAKGKPCVVSIRTNVAHIPFSALAKLTPLEKDEKLNELKKYLLSENVLISAPSFNTRNSISKLGVEKDIFVIRNGISPDPAGFKEEDDDIQSVDITYVGEVSILKGINYLVDAIKNIKATIPDIKVRLIGGGSDMEYISQMVQYFNLEQNILFAGYVKNDAIPKYLQKTKLLVHPSLTETWCNAVAEALAFGVPVVTTAVEGLLELTQNGKFAELVEPADAYGLGNKIVEVLTLSSKFDELKKKAKNAKEYIQKNYTLENQVSELINLYKQSLQWKKV